MCLSVLNNSDEEPEEPVYPAQGIAQKTRVIVTAYLIG